jgi:hypothetical protein
MMDLLQLKAKEMRDLKPKERKQKLRRMKQRGQEKIINGVPYYSVNSYKKYIQQPKTDREATNFEKAQKRVDATIEELVKKYPEPEYKIWVNPATGRGADIIVAKKKASSRYKPYIVYELTNYDRQSYISERDIKRYIETLKQFQCKKKLIVSYEENLYNKKTKTNYRNLLEDNGIEIEIKGEIPLNNKF